MKSTGLIFCYLIFLNCFIAQSQFSVGLNAGYNRIGFLYNISANYQFNKHVFSAGILFYGRDYLFEKNGIGPVLNYAYHFEFEKVFIEPRVKLACMPEKKFDVQLISNDFQLQTIFGRKITSSLYFVGGIGAGIVLNMYKNTVGYWSSTNYINYEISLGLRYNIGHGNN